MKTLRSLILVTLGVYTSTFVITGTEEKKAPATVRLAKSRSPFEPHLVEIEAFGELHKLKLLPAPSPLSAEFKIYTTTLDDHGTLVTGEVEGDTEVPDLYYDPETGSVVAIEGDKVEGFITPSLSIQVSPRGLHEAHRQYIPIPLELKNDYLDLPEGVRTDKPFTEENFDRELVSVSPEVFVVVDSNLSSLIGDKNNVKHYLSVFWKAVNLRFATISDPKIDLVLAGVLIIRESAREPFINENVFKDDYINKDNTLESVSDWLFMNKDKFPKYDLAYLMTGKDMATVESGTIQTGYAGSAWLGGACLVSTAKMRSFNTAMGEDKGAFFSGVMTAAHEVAHNLGSPHDGTNDAKGCSSDEGYIMSYVTGKTNKLFFSSCSQKLMKDFIRSTDGKCLREINVGPKIDLSSQLPGHFFTMDEQCKRITGKEIAYALKSKDENSLCVELVCEWRVQNGRITYIYKLSSGIPAAEGSICKSGGKCTNGVCK